MTNTPDTNNPPPTVSYHTFLMSNAGKFWSIFVGTLIVLGGHYLRSYLSSVDVPFPMELNVIATSLLLMGIASVLIVLSLCCLLLLTAFIRAIPPERNYNELVSSAPKKKEVSEVSEESSSGLFTKNNALTALILFYLVGAPILLTTILLSIKDIEGYRYPDYLFGIILSICILVASIIYAFAKKSENNSFIIKLGFCFFVQLCNAVFWVFPTLIFIQSGLISSKWAVLSSIVLLTGLSIIGLAPYNKKHETFSGGAAAFIKSAILRSPYQFTAFILIAFLTLLPPVSPEIGKGALRFFEIGGGIIHKIHLTEDLKKGLCGIGLKPKKGMTAFNASLLFKVKEGLNNC